MGKEYKSESSELEYILDKYHNAKKYDYFLDQSNKTKIKINYIKDKNNMYYNCLILYITLKYI